MCKRFEKIFKNLEEDKINIDELENVLKEIFNNDTNILQNSKPAVRTNVKRLIRIYDYLKSNL